MVGIATLMGMLVVTMLFCKAFNKKTEDYFCVSIFTVILLLYPFYCMDMLALGRYTVYAVFMLSVLASIFVIIKRTELFCIKNVIFTTISPGICVFSVIILFYSFFLHDNLVELWDELRLWGAVPKALYATEALQLGENALIFPNMQSYPPAMPLFVYFLTALAPTFPEYQIFVAYAVFFSALILPALRDLRWEQWPIFIPVGIFVVWAPCIFTSQGGDFGTFYNSLFIDPILGAMTGYVFYLSATKPFSDGFCVFRFSLALVVLTMLKDSAILFSVFALICAVILYIKDKKHISFRTLSVSIFCVMLPSLAAYASWKYLLRIYDVGTSSSSHLALKNLTWETLQALWANLLEAEMCVLDGRQFYLELAFIPCLLLLTVVYWVHIKNKEENTKQDLQIVWWVMLSAFAAFLIGFCISFGKKLPSFHRYVSALLTCGFVFLILQVFSEVLHLLTASEMEKTWFSVNREKCCDLKKESFGSRMIGKLAIFAQKRPCRAYVMLGLLVSAWTVCLAYSYFSDWQTRKKVIDQWEYDEVHFAVYQIKQNEREYPRDKSEYYLLISDEMVNNSRIHHRTYYELLNTSAHVKNFYNDTNVIGKKEIPEEWTDQDVRDAASKWGEKLVSEGYDYVHVIYLNAFTEQVMEYLGAEEILPGSTYAVTSEEDSVVLHRCNA